MFRLKTGQSFVSRSDESTLKSRKHDTRFCFVHFKVDCLTVQWLLRKILCQLSLCSFDTFGLFKRIWPLWPQKKQFVRLVLHRFEQQTLSFKAPTETHKLFGWDRFLFVFCRRDRNSFTQSECNHAVFLQNIITFQTFLYLVVLFFSLNLNISTSRHLCWWGGKWIVREDDKHRVKDTQRELMITCSYTLFSTGVS